MKSRLIIILTILLVSACGAAAQKSQTDMVAVAAQSDSQVKVLVPEVLATYDHDAAAYTQGLVWYEGIFYESTGLRGESSLRKVDPTTGEVLQQQPVDEIFFAEGLALVGDRLIQLTWQEQLAFVYDRETLELLGGYQYTGEGWGLCYDGEVLYMSDGSSDLFIRNAETFELLSVLPVDLLGISIDQLNELECVGDFIYANVWKENVILQIDKQTGDIVAVVDASNLLTPEEYATLSNGAVLNGIAYDEENQVFYITGKLWSKLFEVQFVEKE